MPAERFHTEGMHHPGIVVPDLEKAKAFYCEMFGFELFSESSWSRDNERFNQIVGLEGSAARFCMLKGKNAYLELFEYEKASTSAQSEACREGIRHLSFVVSNVPAALARCVELGGSSINEPVVVPGGPTTIYCRDPFGNLLELVTPGGRFPPLL